MSTHFEIEKKFLIRRPSEAFLKSFDGCTCDEIEQTYLTCDAACTERVRRRTRDGESRYYHTVKTRISAMRRIETESEITHGEYLELMRRADKKLNTIYKKRYCVPFDGHILEIDVFPFWEKTAFLEIELKSETEAYTLPGDIETIRDVTEDGAYTNRALAAFVPPEETVL